MNRTGRILLNAATVAALVLCAAAMWRVAPDQTTSTALVLAVTEERFNEVMSEPYVSIRRGRRDGQYLVELPGPVYGDLFVDLRRARVSLETSLILLLALPVIRGLIAAARLARRYRLSRLLPAVSGLLCVGLVAWRMFGTPFTYRDSSCFGNFAILHGKPPPISWYGTHLSYDMPLGGGAFPYWLAVGLSLVAPAQWLTAQLRPGHKSLPALNLCPVCGYDLRATPHRCPECGSIPPSPISTAGATRP